MNLCGFEWINMCIFSRFRG